MRARRATSSGAEILEFALAFLPLMAAIAVVLNLSWSIFVASTLQRAVRVGVTIGRTLTATQADGGCLTEAVKQIVRENALGLLVDPNKLALVKVNYYLSDHSSLTDVSTDPAGNMPGNVIKVSVENYPVMQLIPRIVNWNVNGQTDAHTVNVYSAGIIEPSKDLPCIGAAP